MAKDKSDVELLERFLRCMTVPELTRAIEVWRSGPNPDLDSLKAAAAMREEKILMEVQCV